MQALNTQQQQTLEDQFEFPDSLRQTYVVHKIIGYGAYGVVLLAVHRLTDQNVAIKVFQDIFRDCIDAKRILREIAILRQLSHPNIVKIIDLYLPPDGDRFNQVFLVMEWLPLDLKHLPSHSLTAVQVQKMLFQLLQALKYLKECRVLHRDLKPANILVDNEMNLKICDFGLSRTINRKPADVAEPANQGGMARSNGKAQPHLKRPVPMEIPPVPAAPSKKKTPPVEKFAGAFKRVSPLSPKPQTQGFAPTKKVPTTPKQDGPGISEEKEEVILTKHIVTRWYRAPEIILLHPYDYQSDIWSLGCVFAEILSRMSPHHFQGPLFPGRSCYPMSPSQRHFPETGGSIIIMDGSDQLAYIFALIGAPEDRSEDIGFIDRPDVKEYVLNFMKKPACPLQRLFPFAPPAALELLQGMLRFNPRERLTVTQCLEHAFLADMQSTTTSASTRAKVIKLDFEIHPDKLHFIAADLRLLFIREYQLLHASCVVDPRIIENLQKLTDYIELSRAKVIPP